MFDEWIFEDLDHIKERHGERGYANSIFDRHFLDRKGGYIDVVDFALQHGAYTAEYDKSGRYIYVCYFNFNEKTGIDKDWYGETVNLKGIEIVGTLTDKTFSVETVYPKGRIKELPQASRAER